MEVVSSYFSQQVYLPPFRLKEDPRSALGRAGVSWREGGVLDCPSALRPQYSQLASPAVPPLELSILSLSAAIPASHLSQRWPQLSWRSGRSHPGCRVGLLVARVFYAFF